MKGVPVPDSELAEELLQIEEADAWFEYLEATRVQSETRYAEVEPWAWALGGLGFLGSTALKLLHHSEIPVLVVPRHHKK